MAGVLIYEFYWSGYAINHSHSTPQAIIRTRELDWQFRRTSRKVHTPQLEYNTRHPICQICQNAFAILGVRVEYMEQRH
ncbi:hypothetical protein PAAG_12452 [Paracoccidioides lutzii Pb01]|uniref:Uncharacterized protein n=1 Tax=Paracoccidioides lutzii (strain ATCC MYA-826 / Pb01) TaxID=502779 RepID=A0A0A2VIX0_PARBA|nr:hypothetical protein PAAG_12452 [Paracoccidioides lutzii Pb01]KGQ00864.1 hypothetical protein PAAG_12452 [Paracoccidioides lutzii Pb01]